MITAFVKKLEGVLEKVQKRLKEAPKNGEKIIKKKGQKTLKAAKTIKKVTKKL